MSNYNWETGEILLPAAAVPAIRKALRDASNALHKQALTVAADFWTTHAKSTRSSRKYEDALYAYTDRSGREPLLRGMGSTADDLLMLLEDASARPHKLTSKELEIAFPKATARSSVFATKETVIRIEGRKLRWHVSENNHAVEEAHDSPVMRALFGALNKVQWTRGTGGRSWGSDEHAQEAAQDHGYDPIMRSGEWGPKTRHVPLARPVPSRRAR